MKIRIITIFGIYVGLISIVCLILVLLFAPKVQGQMSDTCANGQLVVIDSTNKRYKCLSASIPLVYRATGVNLNSLNTDVATFSNLPSKYIVRRFTGNNASVSLTLATVDLRTAAGGAGTAIISAGALTALTGASKFIDLTLAVTGDTQTAPTLTIRNVTPQGAAVTADFTLEVTPLF